MSDIQCDWIWCDWYFGMRPKYCIVRVGKFQLNDRQLMCINDKFDESLYVFLAPLSVVQNNLDTGIKFRFRKYFKIFEADPRFIKS